MPPNAFLNVAPMPPADLDTPVAEFAILRKSPNTRAAPSEMYSMMTLGMGFYLW